MVHWNLKVGDFSVSDKRKGNLDPTGTLNKTRYLTPPSLPPGQGPGPEFSGTHKSE